MKKKFLVLFFLLIIVSCKKTKDVFYIDTVEVNNYSGGYSISSSRDNVSYIFNSTNKLKDSIYLISDNNYLCRVEYCRFNKSSQKYLCKILYEDFYTEVNSLNTILKKYKSLIFFKKLKFRANDEIFYLTTNKQTKLKLFLDDKFVNASDSISMNKAIEKIDFRKYR